MLTRNSFRGDPLLMDYLKRREEQLTIDIYKGSIDSNDECLSNTDVVIGVEM